MKTMKILTRISKRIYQLKKMKKRRYTKILKMKIMIGKIRSLMMMKRLKKGLLKTMKSIMMTYNPHRKILKRKFENQSKKYLSLNAI
jgi:hypothetical protein